MSKSKCILEKDSVERVQREIEDCQKRITDVLVSTIFAFGVTAISGLGAITNSNSFTMMIFFTSFLAVFVTSGFYILNLGYKIHRNAAFLRHFSKGKKNWEIILKAYRGEYKEKILDSEIRTIGLIYTILSGIFAIYLGYVSYAIFLEIQPDVSSIYPILSGFLIGILGLIIILYAIPLKMIRILDYSKKLDMQIEKLQRKYFFDEK